MTKSTYMTLVMPKDPASTPAKAGESTPPKSSPTAGVKEIAVGTNSCGTASLGMTELSSGTKPEKKS